MAGKRKIHGGSFKAQVALAAHKGDRTVNELAGHYGVRLVDGPSCGRLMTMPYARLDIV
jgi:hypothetical protein